MPSEHRLHPVSILFALAQSVKIFALPGLLVLLTARTSGGTSGTFGRLPANWELWMMLLLIPSTMAAIARYLSFRIRYEGTELVIRSGIIFRNVRHVPYVRIHNLDAVQNVFHRLLGVVEVRVETGGGQELEARISVVPVAVFDQMRARVFEGRERASAAAPEGGREPVSGASAGPAVESRTILRLSRRDLLLFGFLENRGLVVIAAIYGFAWELGLFEGLTSRFLDMPEDGPGTMRELLRSLATGASLSAGRIAALLLGIVVLLAVVRLVSMAWAAIRLHGFHIDAVGEDLRTEFGMITRVAATIPLRRIQSVTVREGPLHRRLGRVSVRAETAGGARMNRGAGPVTAEREWLAPVIRPADLGSFLRHVVPELDVTTLEWQRAHPRAFRRAAIVAALRAVVVAVIAAAFVGWWGAAVLLVGVPWAVFAARKYVQHLGWAATEDVVAFRSGWLWRHLTIARVARVQVVAWYESPFDRRVAMARVRVDTAGAGERSHRIDIPYLARATAWELHRTLAKRAAMAAFRW